MGAEERQPDSPLSDTERAEAQRRGLLSAYELQANRFSFYRLLYMLERVFPESPRLGQAQEQRVVRGGMDLDEARGQIELEEIVPDGR